MAADNFTQDGAPTGGVVLHPRAWVSMKMMIDGQPLADPLEFIPSKLSLRRGSHNKADECELTLDGSVLQLPLRNIDGAFVSVYLGSAASPEDIDSIKTAANRRFVGRWEEADQDWAEATLKIKMQDLSRGLRAHKPVVSTVIRDPVTQKKIKTIDPTPRFSDTLEEAVKKILSIVPGYEQDGPDPTLTIRPTDALKQANLRSLVSSQDHRAQLGPVPLAPNGSAWEAIEKLAGICALHVGVELREIVFRSPEEVFADSNPDPDKRIVFIIGAANANAAPPTFHKRFVENRKGVKVVAMDTSTRKPVSAIWPPDKELPPAHIPKAPKVHQKGVHKAPTAKKETEPPARDVFELDPAAYSDSALLDQAKKIYLERATQECDGTIMTPFCDERILSLKNGARFFIKLTHDLDRKISEIGDDTLAARFLQQQLPGLSAQQADILLRVIRKPANDFWYCRSVTFDWPSEMIAHVDFINLLVTTT